MNMKFWRLLLTTSAMLVAVIFVAPLQAVPADVFYDDFESPVSSEQPDNGGYPGDWTASPAGGCYTASAHDAGEVTPYEGSQVLRYNYLYGESNFAEGAFESALGTGDTLHAEMAIWLKIPETTGTFNLRFLDSADVTLFNAFNKDGYIRNSADDQNYTTLTWLTDDWNFFEVDYVVGSTSLTYTLNGTPETRTTAAHSEISQIWFGSGGANPADFLVDVLLVQADTGGGPTPKNPGDVDEDNFVGGADLTTILTNWGNSGVTWTDGDVDPYNDGITTGDDFIGGGDYTAVLTAWGTSYGPEAIPEPVSLLVLCGAGLLLVLRRR